MRSSTKEREHVAVGVAQMGQRAAPRLLFGSTEKGDAAPGERFVCGVDVVDLERNGHEAAD